MKKSLIKVQICLFSLLFIINPLEGTSDTTHKEILIVRGNGNYPPNEMEINGHLVGVHIDLIKEVSAILKHKVVFKSVPWKRAVNMLKYGAADAITFFGKNPEREKFTYYFDGNITSITENAFVVLKNREKEIKYSGAIKEFESYRIGTLRGYLYGPAFDSATYLKKHIVDKMDQLLNLLIAQRIDLGIVYKDGIKYTYQQTGFLDNVTFLQPPASYVPNYLGFSKARKHQQLAKKFSEAMEAFKKTVIYQKILKKYGLE
jgi:polar amino acid transport system substrate-binding protein